MLHQHHLFANQKKCLFGQQSVKYLSHIISSKGVAMDPFKVQCVLEWPAPSIAKGVNGCLGLTSYYRRFIKDCGTIAKPFTELTKKSGSCEMRSLKGL